MQKIAIVENLQSEITELEVAFGVECGAQACQVVVRDALVEQFGGNAFFDQLRKHLRIAHLHFSLRELLADRLETQRIEQQARGDIAVRGVFLDQRARRQDQRLAHFLDRDAFVQILKRGLQYYPRVDGAAQALA